MEWTDAEIGYSNAVVLSDGNRIGEAIEYAEDVKEGEWVCMSSWV